MLPRNESPATHLLIALLVRFPEVSAVRLEPQSQSLLFSFFLQGEVSAEEQKEVRSKIESYFLTARELDKKFPNLGKLVVSPMGQISLLTYEQTVTKAHVAEISLLVTLLNECFKGRVIADPGYTEEDHEFQEQMIDRLLVHREVLADNQQIIAYREGGKVFVYNS